MNMTKLGVLAAVLCVGEVFAESSVTVSAARQDWPWSDKILIDYTLTGDTSDIEFKATWMGQTTPVSIWLAPSVASGTHRLEIDPAMVDNLRGKALPGFSVTASAANPADRKYLVIDLVNGGVTYLADVPQGGWPEEYKKTKMAFARIPAGVYVNGLSKAQMLNVGIVESKAAGSAYKTRYKRTVTLTSDFYMGIYKVTTAQYNILKTGTDTTGTTAARFISYNEVRGTTNEPNEVNWPITKYKVETDTLAQKMRDLAGGGLIVDLPVEEQWEAAARCGKTTYWSNGGLETDDYSTLSNYINQIAMWNGSGYTSKDMITTVGIMQPNDFGLYDTSGIGGEWALDCQAYQRNDKPYVLYGGLSDSTDPVGASNAGHQANLANRVTRGGGGTSASTALHQMMPSVRALMYPSANDNTYVRFCIHLKPLAFTE